MSYLFSGITPRIRSRLNDAINALYTDAVLLPFGQDAADELQLELERNGLLSLQKISTAIVVPINTTVLTYSSTPALPADMLEPMRLEERLSGSSDLYVEMIRREWTPDILPTDSLRYWDYREESIFFVGSTSARDVKVYYLKRLLNITTVNSVITLNNSQLFMIARTAGLACRYIGSNPTRADQLDREAEINLSKLTNIGAKSKQGARTRRRPFALVGRRWWT